MTNTISKISQRVMSHPNYQNPGVKRDFSILFGHIGGLQMIVEQFEKAGGLQAAVNQLQIMQENWPEPQHWAVAWVDAHGEQQHEFFPPEQRHVAEALYARLDTTGIQTIEMTQLFLTKEKKENDNGNH